LIGVAGQSYIKSRTKIPKSFFITQSYTKFISESVHEMWDWNVRWNVRWISHNRSLQATFTWNWEVMKNILIIEKQAITLIWLA